MRSSVKKTRKQTAQSSIDYLILTAVLIVVIVPFFYSTRFSLEGFRESTLVDATQAILAAADTIVNLGYGSAIREVIYIPNGIISYEMIQNFLIVNFRLTNISVAFKKDIIGRFPITEGRHYINIFNNGTNILFYECGNNVLEAFEQCDGTSVDNCGTGSCTPPSYDDDACKCFCDDDFDCPPTYYCDANGICQPGASCGNGIIEGNEQCDDGNFIETDTCNNLCLLTICGDTIIQTPNGNGDFEECDTDGAVCGAGGVCLPDCTCASGGFGFCGDGIMDPSLGEECDPPGSLCLDGTTCWPDCTCGGCTTNADCPYGDQVCVNGNCQDCSNNFECNIGNMCLNGNCVKIPSCGDGFCAPQLGEDCRTCGADCACGPGTICSSDGTCAPPNTGGCGDGICDAGENSCVCEQDCGATCGDACVGTREECDDGNAIPNDQCDNCKLTSCGDGYVQDPNGKGQNEQCEPADDTACPGLCISPGSPGECTCNTCGNGMCDPWEDANSCASDCYSGGFCGDNKVDSGEECDGSGGGCPAGQVCVNCNCIRIPCGPGGCPNGNGNGDPGGGNGGGGNSCGPQPGTTGSCADLPCPDGMTCAGNRPSCGPCAIICGDGELGEGEQCESASDCPPATGGYKATCVSCQCEYIPPPTTGGGF